MPETKTCPHCGRKYETYCAACADEEDERAMHTIKACRCGLTFTAEMWAALPRVDRWYVGVRDYGLDMRNCTCGSTIAIQVTSAPTADVTKARAA
jgi:transcription elongation factor Elf1